MISKPIFQNYYHVEVVKDESAVYLLGERNHHVLNGRFYLELAVLMNGRLTSDEIITRLSPDFPDLDIRGILSHMELKGYITEADLKIPVSLAAFWNLQKMPARDAMQKISAMSITVKNMSGVDCEPFISMLTDIGFNVRNDGDFHVIVVDDYAQPQLAEWNKKVLKGGKPWLLVKPVGSILWFGPVFIPGQTGCWKCLLHRLEGHREVEMTLQRICKIQKPFLVSKASLPTTILTAFSIMATEIAQYALSPQSSALVGQITTLDLLTFQTQKHVLTKRPQCPACGNINSIKTQELKPISLTPRKKKFTEDGGHRICSPAETLEKYGHLISPITGVVSEVKPIFKSPDGLVSVHSGSQISARGSNSLAELKHSLRTKGTGKGKSDIQSQASAFSEAVERYSALYHGDEYTIMESTNGLGDLAIPIEDCLLISENQYENRLEWNKTQNVFHFIPERLDRDRKIEWTPMWSFTEQKHKYIPAAIAYLKYPPAGENPYFVPMSNGLAAGNVLEEAILQGFMEIVERDAVSIWWYNKLSMPGVDISRFNDPYFPALQEYYHSIGREILVLDVTHDFAIPAFAAVSRKVNADSEYITFGFGAHFEPRIGISRALTEMNQALYRMVNIAAAPPPKSGVAAVEMSWFKNATIQNQPYLAPDKSAKTKSSCDYESYWSDDLKKDVERCIDITHRLGLEILVRDMTRPDVGFSVVRVVIPGTRSFPAHFAKGRLFDVPVRLGKMSTPLKENDFNAELLTI